MIKTQPWTYLKETGLGRKINYSEEIKEKKKEQLEEVLYTSTIVHHLPDV